VDEELERLNSKYTEEVQIVVYGEDYLWWIPGSPVLASAPGATRDIAMFIEEYIESKSMGGTISASPVGPHFPASVKSIHAVVWAFLTTYGSKDVRFIGKIPSLRDLGLNNSKEIH
jgi:hypothetical protein